MSDTKRVLVAMTVPADTDNHDLAMQLDGHFGSEADATVWEWDDFWGDVVDGVISPTRDKSRTDGET